MTYYYYRNAYYDKAIDFYPPDDRGVSHGDGCFETFLSIHGKGEYLEDHLERLRYGLGILSIPAPEEMNNTETILKELYAFSGYHKSIIRLSVTRGVNGMRGLKMDPNAKSTFLIEARPFPSSESDAPLTASIASIRRNETSPIARIKAIGGYLDNILMFREAQENGYDDALFLNGEGRPVCFTIGALLIKDCNGTYCTPPESEGCLSSISLKHFNVFSKEALSYRPLTIEDLRHAQEIYRVNSVTYYKKCNVDLK